MKNNNYITSLGIKNQNDRNQIIKCADEWLEDKKLLDGAEELWRIYDKLYDLSVFIPHHPGGKFWLEVSKGLDITEAFESHHISTVPEKMLEKFYIRKAIAPRNSPFTFEANGFYKTLKRNIREVLKDIPKDDVNKSKIVIDSLLLCSVVFLVMATKYINYSAGFLAGFTLALMNVVAHNYYHQKDNFRMYYSDVGMSPSREWRIIHIFSHHAHPNSALDIQAYLMEPFVQYYPREKNVVLKYVSYIYTPLLLWPLLHVYVYTSRLYNCTVKRRKGLLKTDLIPWILPTLSYLITCQPLLTVLKMWFFVILVSAFWFSFIALTTTHYHPEIFVDGDKPRSKDEMDWGINQLDTVGDKAEVKGSHFLSLIMLGDHALHHLFPSLDHGILHHLYPAVDKTIKQFNLDFRITGLFDLIKGYFLQMSKEFGNPNPPTLRKYRTTLNNSSNFVGNNILNVVLR